MNLILAYADALSECLYAELGHYRYQIFIERLGWKLSTSNGLEWDQFDMPSTVHIIARSEVGIVGCARLLPTTGPYLLGEIFPQLMNGQTPPCSPDIWELSRFAAINPREKVGNTVAQVPSALAIEILNTAAQYVKDMGGNRLITVSPLSMERLLRKTGFHTYRAGPPFLVDDSPIFACWIDLLK